MSHRSSLYSFCTKCNHSAQPSQSEGDQLPTHQAPILVSPAKEYIELSNSLLVTRLGDLGVGVSGVVLEFVGC